MTDKARRQNRRDAKLSLAFLSSAPVRAQLHQSTAFAPIQSQSPAAPKWKQLHAPLSPILAGLLAACTIDRTGLPTVTVVAADTEEPAGDSENEGGDGGGAGGSEDEGGGAGGSDDESLADFQVYALDGAIEGAKIYIDINSDGLIDAGDTRIAGTTGADGKILVGGTHKGKDLIVDLGDAFDIATQETFASGATLRHQLPAESNGATLIVSPISTLITQLMEADAQLTQSGAIEMIFGTGTAVTAAHLNDVDNFTTPATAPEGLADTDPLAIQEAVSTKAVIAQKLIEQERTDNDAADSAVTIMSQIGTDGLQASDLDSDAAATAAIANSRSLAGGTPVANPDITRGTNTQASVLEDNHLIIDIEDWGFRDPAGNTGGASSSLASVTITGWSNGTDANANLGRLFTATEFAKLTDAYAETVATEAPMNSPILYADLANLVFVPNQNKNGDVTLSYTLNDGEASSVSAQLSFSVTPVADSITGLSLTQNREVNQDEVVTINPDNGDASDAITYAFAAGAGDTHNHLFDISSAGEVAFKADVSNYHYADFYSLRVTASNAEAASELTQTLAFEDVSTTTLSSDATSGQLALSAFVDAEGQGLLAENANFGYLGQLNHTHALTSAASDNDNDEFFIVSLSSDLAINNTPVTSSGLSQGSNGDQFITLNVSNNNAIVLKTNLASSDVVVGRLNAQADGVVGTVFDGVELSVTGTTLSAEITDTIAAGNHLVYVGADSGDFEASGVTAKTLHFELPNQTPGVDTTLTFEVSATAAENANKVILINQARDALNVVDATTAYPSDYEVLGSLNSAGNGLVDEVTGLTLSGTTLSLAANSLSVITSLTATNFVSNAPLDQQNQISSGVTVSTTIGPDDGWRNSLEEDMAVMTDGDKTTSTSFGLSVHPTPNAGDIISFQFHNDYRDVKFHLFNRHTTNTDRINDTEVRFLRDGVIIETGVLQEANEINTSEIVLSTDSGNIFDQVDIFFPNAGKQNFREVEIYGTQAQTKDLLVSEAVTAIEIAAADADKTVVLNAALDTLSLVASNAVLDGSHILGTLNADGDALATAITGLNLSGNVLMLATGSTLGVISEFEFEVALSDVQDTLIVTQASDAGTAYQFDAGDSLTADTSAVRDTNGATPSSFTYQWQASTDGTTWTDITTDGTSACYSVPAESAVGTQFRVTVSFTQEGNQTLESQTAVFAKAVGGAIAVQMGTGAASDILDASSAAFSQHIQGGALADTITASAHGDAIAGGTGEDTITLGNGADRVIYRYDGGNDAADWQGMDGSDTIHNFERGVDKLVLVDINDNPITDLSTFNTQIRSDDTIFDNADDELLIALQDPDADDDYESLILTFAGGGATLTLNFVTPVDTYDSIAYLNLEDLLDGAGGDSFDGLELTTSLDIL